MRQSSNSAPRWLLLWFILLAPCADPVSADEPLPEGSLQAVVAKIARQTKDYLVMHQQQMVSVGAFSNGDPSGPNTGVGIQKSLVDQLTALGIKVSMGASMEIQGDYRRTKIPHNGRLAAQLRCQLRMGKKLIASLGGMVVGVESLGPILAITGDINTNTHELGRDELVNELVLAPQQYIQGSEARPSPKSPYGVEVLIRKGNEWVPRPAVPQQNHAFVQIEREEVYALRLVNDADRDAAVTVWIDGLSVFAFSKEGDYKHLILPKRSSGLLRGWHITNTHSDSFLVTSYSKSAAAELLTSKGAIGTISVIFANSWAHGETVPHDEKGARLLASRGEEIATARGPRVDQKFQEVERQIGAPRAVVTIRYSRPN